jgi:hypothetical protein
MNNYSWLQKRLHQLALAPQFLREAAFDLESSVASSLENNGDHVFVSGLARSGTTILLNAIYQSDIFASLSYSDMPFVLAPNLWSKITFTNTSTETVERAHGDGIQVSAGSPEAFEEVFWKTFDDTDDETQEKFKRYVDLILIKNDRKRYLSKNNQNIRRLEVISGTLPNAKILIPFRSPIQHAKSLLTQHTKFIIDSKNDKFISDYMQWTGHTEFGPNYRPIYSEDLQFKNAEDINHWLEQWYQTYKNCLKTMCHKPNVYFVCYEQLCNMPTYWYDLLGILNLEKRYDFPFRESKKGVPDVVSSDYFQKASLLYEELKLISSEWVL